MVIRLCLKYVEVNMFLVKMVLFYLGWNSFEEEWKKFFVVCCIKILIVYFFLVNRDILVG